VAIRRICSGRAGEIAGTANLYGEGPPLRSWRSGWARRTRSHFHRPQINVPVDSKVGEWIPVAVVWVMSIAGIATFGKDLINFISTAAPWSASWRAPALVFRWCSCGSLEETSFAAVAFERSISMNRSNPANLQAAHDSGGGCLGIRFSGPISGTVPCIIRVY
jgi:hypothetical protein